MVTSPGAASWGRWVASKEAQNSDCGEQPTRKNSGRVRATTKGAQNMDCVEQPTRIRQFGGTRGGFIQRNM